MPTFDPKKIPTLDDIIEKAAREDAAAESTTAAPDAADDTSMAGNETFDIGRFLAEAQAFAENRPPRDTGPELGDVDDIAIAGPDEVDNFLFDDVEVELLDETEIEFTEYFNDSGDADDYGTVTAAADENTAAASFQPIAVGPLVKNIVRQMLPDIEQQLVFMLQKAIEEKLPAELIKPAAADKDSKD